MPAKFKAADGSWTGFAARMRVEIVNLQNGKATESVRADWRRWAMAKPLYGTTLTHYAVLWRHWGGDPLMRWHRESRATGLKELNGNAAVKDAVGAGVCDFGYTDTDDFFEARDAGLQVRMEPVRVEGAGTIVIPNTVAIIRGTRRVSDARKLVDFLLSQETELALARSKSRQIPLGRSPRIRCRRKFASWRSGRRREWTSHNSARPGRSVSRG
jgi:iron(III) transport system substrate-binding protein